MLSPIIFTYLQSQSHQTFDGLGNDRNINRTAAGIDMEKPEAAGAAIPTRRGRERTIQIPSGGVTRAETRLTVCRSP